MVAIPYIPIPKWWLLPTILSAPYLLQTREYLNKNNLFDVYSPNEYPAVGPCTKEQTMVRTLSGICNDLDKPAMGSLHYRFGRNVPINKTFPDTANLLNPNPREVARKTMVRDKFIPAPHLNLFVTAWIQFQVHDWFATHKTDWGNTIDVPVPAGDPLLAKDITTIQIPRTIQSPQSDPSRPPVYENKVTHWWDLSQIYGVTPEMNQKVRTGVDGKMKVDPTTGLLPFEEDGIELAAVKDNWWTGLSVMHNIFVREHNHIADMLKSHHPDWNDEKLFGVARLINSAVVARIHLLEWTMAILGQDFLDINNPIANIALGMKKDLSGTPFSLTEEFVSVYRYGHPLLPDNLPLRNATSGLPHSSNKTYTLFDMFDRNHAQILKTESFQDVLASFGMANPGQIVLHNNPAMLGDLHLPGPGGARRFVDLMTTELVRDRERGVPRYNEFRRLVKLVPHKSISDITPDKATQDLLSSLYGADGLEKIDLLVGSLAEGYRPDGFVFGDTQFQIFLLMATRRITADRFLTDSFTDEYYTKEGIKWVKSTTFRTILARQFPALKKYTDKVDNGFFTWKP
ncbi:hypothetical protein HK104_006828 [Borealophlyctis nickersoniae]|nr:hypothetical protein HK104_006828 [Borealophlyctis nickersoniae]